MEQKKSKFSREEIFFLLKNGNSQDKAAVMDHLLTEYFFEGIETVSINEIIKQDNDWWKKLQTMLPLIAQSGDTLYNFKAFSKEYTDDLKAIKIVTEYLFSNEHKEAIIREGIIRDILIFANKNVDNKDINDLFSIIHKLLMTNDDKMLSIAERLLCNTVKTEQFDRLGSYPNKISDGLLSFLWREVKNTEINPFMLIRLCDYFAQTHWQSEENIKLLKNLSLELIEQANWQPHRDNIAKFIDFSFPIFNSTEWNIEMVKSLVKNDLINIQKVMDDAGLNSLVQNHPQQTLELLMSCQGKNLEHAQKMLYRILDRRIYFFKSEQRCEMIAYMDFGLSDSFSAYESAKIITQYLQYMPHDNFWEEKMPQIVRKCGRALSSEQKNVFVTSDISDKAKLLFKEEIESSFNSSETIEKTLAELRQRLNS